LTASSSVVLALSMPLPAGSTATPTGWQATGVVLTTLGSGIQMSVTVDVICVS
jgi:hypothetical protein